VYLSVIFGDADVANTEGAFDLKLQYKYKGFFLINKFNLK